MWAWLGLIGSLLIAVFSGWPCIYILAQKGELLHSSGLKPARVLAWNIVGAYAGVSWEDGYSLRAETIMY